MALNRRNFLKLSAGAVLASVACAPQDKTSPAGASEKPFRELHPMTGDVVPISDEERLGRIEKAKRLMKENGIQAIYLEAGTSMFYFIGVRWWNSERMFGLVIPSRGDIAWSCPTFEEDRARELIRFGDDIRTWEEDESPYRRIADAASMATGQISAGLSFLESRTSVNGRFGTWPKKPRRLCLQQRV